MIRYLLFLGLATSIASAQVIPFDSPRWRFDSERGKIVTYQGRQALYMKGGQAVVHDSEFRDGVIEFDVAFTEERGFMGAIWRSQGRGNREEFYIRPHQSGNPDANQYTPVFNGMSCWQLYHGPGYGAAVTYNFKHWISVKIVVSGNAAEVYIGDLQRPALFIPELKHAVQSGQVGLTASNFAPAWFSNFQFRSGTQVLQNKPSPTPAAAMGKVMSWQVSQPFNEKDLAGKNQLAPADKAHLSWETLQCETWGLANLSRLHRRTNQHDTVYARITLTAKRAQVVSLKFGYSDRVKVFFNDRRLYSGDNGYRSRDYRYLGTIGLFDQLHLPLAEGENELMFAVSENFGGWGLLAEFEEMEGVTWAP